MSSDNTSNKENIVIYFWNESANKINLDKKEENNEDVDKKDSEKKQSKTKQAISHKALEVKLRWKKKKYNFCNKYKKGLKKLK